MHTKTDATARTHLRGRLLRLSAAGAIAVGLVLAVGCSTQPQNPQSASPSAQVTQAAVNLPPGDLSRGADNFYTSDKVDTETIGFTNLYGSRIVGNLFVPKNLDRNSKTPAIVVGHPMGAVRQQAANLYATKMAEQGFVTLTFDLAGWGESEGLPDHVVSPDVYAEDFSAAVDYLRTQPFVDKEQIGAIGICGSGGFVISAAKIDPRIKAIATVSMYDMGAATRDGIRNAVTPQQRDSTLRQAAERRDAEFGGAETEFATGTPEQLTADTDPISREFYDFYRTARGYSPNTTTHRTLTSNVKFMNFYPFQNIETISPRPMLFIAGENAHSLEFSEDAYQLAAQPKELLIVPDAGHVDLYDRTQVIPFDKLATFFDTNLG